MMHLFLTILFLSALNARCSTIDTLDFSGISLLYHTVSCDKPTKKLLIFMHGATSQYKNQGSPKMVPITDLIEDNEAFISSMTRAGFDIMLPISHNEYNWLEEKGKEFIYALVEDHQETYDNIVISGFSDGGTGAYRFFYDKPNQFSGLIVFNGYPQLDNHYKNVDYRSITNKPIVFYSSFKDKVIPYEFLLVEFRRQQIVNKNTFFRLVEGDHRFNIYTDTDFNNCTRLLARKKESLTVLDDSIIVYPPFDGVITNNIVTELYSFRKKTGKSFGMSKLEITRTDFEFKSHNKMLANGSELKFHPSIIKKEQLDELEYLEFVITIDGVENNVKFINWFTKKTW